MGNAEEEVGCFCSSCLGGWEGERVGCWEGKVSSRLCGAVYSLLAGPRGKLTITCESAVFFRNNNQNWQRFKNQNSIMLPQCKTHGSTACLNRQTECLTAPKCLHRADTPFSKHTRKPSVAVISHTVIASLLTCLSRGHVMLFASW